MNARVASLVCFLATAASAVLPPPPASCSGSVNTLPLWTGEPTLVSTVPGGAKYNVVSNATAVPVILVHLYGDDAAMGRAYGALLKDELRVLLPEVLAYMYSQMNSSLAWISEPWRDVIMAEGLEAALNLTWAVTEPFSPPHWRALLQGVADGSGLSFMEVARFSMIPELLRAQCSIMGAWGAATAGGSAAGGLVQLRSLDWDTAGPFQQFPLIATFHPDAGAAGGVGGAAHTTVAWPGIMGALTGFSSSGLAISEKVFDAYTGPNARLGYPWHFLLADILRFDIDLDAALSRIASANRTCSIWIGIGDGAAREAKIVAYSHTTVTINNARNFPAYANHDRFADALFINKHVQPSAEPCMNDAMHAVYGAIDADAVWRFVAAVEMTGDAHVAVYDFDARMMYYATATPAPGALPAYSQPHLRFNMSALWGRPEAPPA